MENAKYPQNLNGAMTERVGYFANTLPPTCNENQDDWANMQTNISYRESGGVIPDFMIPSSMAEIASIISDRDAGRRGCRQTLSIYNKLKLLKNKVAYNRRHDMVSPSKKQ